LLNISAVADDLGISFMPLLGKFVAQNSVADIQWKRRVCREYR
jgi:hypothetical protein